MGAVPTITIDKVDGLQMFLSKDSMHVEIVSAKSSALNVMVPKDDGDFVSLIYLFVQFLMQVYTNKFCFLIG
jgi:adenylyl cyclase-associated protein